MRLEAPRPGRPGLCRPPAAPADFVNGLALPGNLLDQSGGTTVNDGRVGYFSDLLYDAKRGQWWALSDRGSGGGTLHYATRMQRFKVDINKRTGAISKFKIVKTVVSRTSTASRWTASRPIRPTCWATPSTRKGSSSIRARATSWSPTSTGPSLYEFKRNGKRVRTFTTPENLIPGGPDGTPNFRLRRRQHRRQADEPRLRRPRHQPRRRLRLRDAAGAMLDEGGGNGVQPHREVRHRDRHGRGAKYAYQSGGGASAGPGHLRAARPERSRVPGARKRNNRVDRRGRGGDAAKTRRSSASTC